MALGKTSRRPTIAPPFDVEAFLNSSGVAKTSVKYARGESIFAQGDAGDDVLYIRTGGVKLAVVSKTGREAVVAMLGPGTSSARGVSRVSNSGWAAPRHHSQRDRVRQERQDGPALHRQHAMSDRFITHMLSRNIRIEEDLIDQLFNSSEKRLARTLLLLARYGEWNKPARVVRRFPRSPSRRWSAPRARG
jgi:CRP-like cAMP-binding protein